MTLLRVFVRFNSAGGYGLGAYTYHVVGAFGHNGSVTHKLFKFKFVPSDQRLSVAVQEISYEGAQRKMGTPIFTINPLPSELQSIIDIVLIECLQKINDLPRCKHRKTGENKPNSCYKKDVLGQIFIDFLEELGSSEDWGNYQKKVGKENIRQVYNNPKPVTDGQ